MDVAERAQKKEAHHKVRILYKEYHGVCPLVEMGTLPTPLSSECAPENVGGAHSPAGEGLGKSQYRRLEKKLGTLATL